MSHAYSSLYTSHDFSMLYIFIDSHTAIKCIQCLKYSSVNMVLGEGRRGCEIIWT